MNSLIKEILDYNNMEYVKKPGFPNIGKRADGEEFSKAVKKIEDAWYLYDTELYKLKTNNNIIKLATGNPINYNSFPYGLKKFKKQLPKKMYEYPPAAGDEKSRDIISCYLKKQGYPSYINYDNVIITCGTTQAFYLIIKSICHNNDVILMTGPNYGLFTFIPERLNVSVEIINLDKEDNYLINPTKLEKRVKEINNNLKNKYKNKKYTPRVKAFLNINPHNPLGTVLTEKNIDILNKLGKICQKNELFIIDDLIYRDITYNRKELAKPIGTINKYFNYSISLFGLSKSYGFANTRSGFIVASSDIIRVLRNNLFYTMDSAPYLQSLLLSSIYNNNIIRDINYKKYFKKVIKIYKYNLELMTSLIEGIDKQKDNKIKNKIKKDIKKYSKNQNILYEGIPNVKVKIKPQSGFFLLVDFTNIKKYTNIKNEEDLLKYLYEECSVKFLIGKSFSWPNENEIIARFSYSLNKEEIIIALERINIAIRKITYEANGSNSKS